MEATFIYLDEDDDIVSARDRLEWTDEPRIVLVVPAAERVLSERLDLALLRRHADQIGKEVGLISVDGEQRKLAREVGMPAFASMAVANGRRGRREWWRARAVAPPGLEDDLLLPRIDDADRQEVYRRLTPRAGWQTWLLRYAAIFLFFATLSLIFVATAYAVPGATITLKPLVRPLNVSRPVVADPQLANVSYSEASIPARLLAVTVNWRASVNTTGIIEIPDAPARGTVIFANLLAQPVTVPAGTRVRTSAGEPVTFQTIRTVELPDAIGGTAEVEVVAVKPGRSGNVAINQINRIEGPLSLQLEVRNLSPTEGGGVRQAAAVTTEDRERLRAQVLQFLQARAASEMESLLTTDEFLASESLRIGAILDETYSHFVDEQANQLTLEMRVELEGTAVDASQANGLVYQELATAVAEGYHLAPDSLRFRRGEVLNVDGEGRVNFMMNGEGIIAADLNLNELLDRIAGQKIDAATVYLYEQLPLRDYPAIRVRPNWFDRVPYLPERIRTQIVTE